ncbi:MAG: BtpA/SgcQ family protein [Oscillospiraceae bacterium]|nr:BtpA/SgcQ family protein [Oscillospiraceae bacterium]
MSSVDFTKKPVIACIHLLPTPGTFNYDGNVEKIYELAIKEAKAFEKAGVDALMIENHRDKPFFPDTVPNETVALMAGVGREIIKNVKIPIGLNVLRNDSEAAISIATSIGAKFIRINVHVGAVLAPHGIIQTKAHKTLRLAKSLGANVEIFADAGVKHAYPFAYKNIKEEIRDLSVISNAIIVSGETTGSETKVSDLITAKENTTKPVLIGSGITVDNIDNYYSSADGFIVGSYFKTDGKATSFVDEEKLEKFMNKVLNLRKKGQ